MYYAVIHRPKIDISAIQSIRLKYDPTYSLIKPHVTLVFPFLDKELGIDELTRHVMRVSQNIRPFAVRWSDFELSWDQWLFLTPTEGRADLDSLHDQLYAGQLHSLLRADIPYVPHIGLGQFKAKDSDYSLKDPKAVPLDEGLYRQAREEIDEQNLAYDYTVEAIEIISINDEFTHTETVKRFALG